MDSVYERIFNLIFTNNGDAEYDLENQSLIKYFNDIVTNFKHLCFILRTGDLHFIKSKYEDLNLVFSLNSYYVENGIFPIHYIFMNKYITIDMIDFVLSKGFKLKYENESESITYYLLKQDLEEDRVLEILNYLKEKSYDFMKINKITKSNIFNEIAVCECKSIKIYDFIYNINNDINNKLFNFSPLMTAAKTNNEELFCYLLNKNTNYNDANSNNNSILMYCCMNSNLELVKKLIENGVDINKKDNQNDSAIYYACGCELKTEINYELIKLLLENGADISGSNDDGHNALHYCCGSYQIYRFEINFDVIKLLIQNNCDTTKIDSSNKTFLDYLVQNSNDYNSIKEIINLLNLTYFQKNKLIIKYNNLSFNEDEEEDREYNIVNINFPENAFNTESIENNNLSVNLIEYNKLVEDLDLIEYIEKDKEDTNNRCTICFENCENSRFVKCVNNHCFHDTCINSWIKESNKIDCPLCTNEMILSKIYI